MTSCRTPTLNTPITQTRRHTSSNSGPYEPWIWDTRIVDDRGVPAVLGGTCRLRAATRSRTSALSGRFRNWWNSKICIVPFVLSSPRETPVEPPTEAISAPDILLLLPFTSGSPKDVGIIDKYAWKQRQIRQGFEPENTRVAEWGESEL
jgi:hypothetical protein